MGSATLCFSRRTQRRRRQLHRFQYCCEGLDHGVGHPSCLVIFTLVVRLSDCTGISQTEQSALSGGAMGAVGGALLGVMAGHAGMGAAIGGEVGPNPTLKP